MNLSHYLGFVNGADYKAFGDLVYRKVGDFAYLNTQRNEPFNATCQEITGQGGEYKSRVILVSENPLGDITYFWPVNYCPPAEARDQNLLAGTETRSIDVRQVIDAQVSQFQSAMDGKLPFANYMTLTPSNANCVSIVLSVRPALFVLAGQLKSDKKKKQQSKIVYSLAWSLDEDVADAGSLGFGATRRAQPEDRPCPAGGRV